MRWLKRLLALLLGLLIGALGVIGYLLHFSKPRLDGEVLLSGLQAGATLERDALGVVTISANKRIDLARALGYVHAQERFFQMDLLRRTASGELAELFGAGPDEVIVKMDEGKRVHRFRARMPAVLARLSEAQRVELNAYAEGVQAGLDGLGAPPFPYPMLRVKPKAWTPEDSLLVPIAMFFDLQGGSNRRELAFDQMRSAMPKEVFDFITRSGTPWDAPMRGEPIATPPIPDAGIFDLRLLDKKHFETDAPVEILAAPRGSNNFAVAGVVSETGSAIVADDMHLGLGVPNIWFRARLKHGEGARAVDISGVTLPGLPAVVVGSNTRVAWAFTNSYGDWLDFVRVPYRDQEQQTYDVMGQTKTIETHVERVAIKGRATKDFVVRETVFGPITAKDSQGHDLALRWTAHSPDALNMDLQKLEYATTVDEAIAIANGAGIPAQNFVVGDASGAVAWTIAGRIPKRIALATDPSAENTGTEVGTGSILHDLIAGAKPISTADSAALVLEPKQGNERWADASQLFEAKDVADGAWQWLAHENYPRLHEPTRTKLWSANARVVDGEALKQIGDGGYEFGARAAQIRDDLAAKEQFDENDLLAIQLDDRAVFMEHWRGVLQAALKDHEDARFDALKALTAKPLQRASVDAVDYRLVRAFRLNVHERVMNALAAPVRVRKADFVLPPLPQAEGVVWQLIHEQPLHLLDARFESWEALLLDAAARVVKELGEQPGGLAARTWGERNTASIQSPLSKAVPFLGRWLDMPREPLPGDSNMPRVQAPDFGASQRMVVSPGHEARGIFHMPTGQSGHPLSPFYRAGHSDWTQGKPSAFWPGETKHRIEFKPRR